MSEATNNHIAEIAAQFDSGGSITATAVYGRGNINDTFLITTTGALNRFFILQRINTEVFKNPEKIIHNLRIVSDHVRSRIERRKNHPGRAWQIPYLINSRDGKGFYLDQDGGFWRALSFIDHARPLETLRNEAEVFEAGYALGMFHDLLDGLDPGRLLDTLPGFHVTPQYLIHFDNVVRSKGFRIVSEEERFCAQCVEEYRKSASVLEAARKERKLRIRIIHGDPKTNNIMVDRASGYALGMIDLDTVKPGLIHYDVGDCLRSCCNPAGEEVSSKALVAFDADICHGVLKGYMAAARPFLTKADLSYFFDAIILLPYELGLRFFTDYIEGDVYFKTSDRHHNLRRAAVQFTLMKSIESQEKQLQKIVSGLAQEL